jgi:hypothetical protein
MAREYYYDRWSKSKQVKSMLDTCRDYDEIISSLSERFSERLKYRVLEANMVVAYVEINYS